MKGKLVLIPVDSPVERMKVIATDDSEGIHQDIGVIESIFEGTIWRVKLPSRLILPYGCTELEQIAVEYYDPVPPHKLAKQQTLPLHPSDWEKALPLIGQEVEFFIEKTRSRPTTYDQPDWEEPLDEKDWRAILRLPKQEETWEEIFNNLTEGSLSWYNLYPTRIKELLKKKYLPPKKINNE